MTNRSDATGPVSTSVARALTACTGFASASAIQGSKESGADKKSHYPGPALLDAANWDTQESTGENKAVHSRKGTTGILFKQPDNLAVKSKVGLPRNLKVVLEMPWRMISACDPLRTDGRPVSSALSFLQNYQRLSSSYALISRMCRWLQ
ncbi:hypothetical protein EDD18DRAFT_1108726 [Armillaria luteobubalina]|uniref:Uncharacterized protein n=1 Tax=Armillaria luteobubalina TaxID=153913 RepID=A0AA39PY35_9AGAR|nr:hypothetical protein EDD18DRAFT_1108726 [Armillaria luteobubalina]